MKNVGSERLEELLDFWHGSCWMDETIHGLAKKVHPGAVQEIPLLRNWREFLSIVYDNRVSSIKIGEWCMPEDAWRKDALWANLATFPLEFFEWSRRSRRIFHLPPGLTRVLGTATYPKVKWDDVILPYDSFVITLDEPIMREDQVGVWSSYDTILVTTIREWNAIYMRLLHAPHVDAADSYWRTERVARRSKLLIKREQYERARRFLDKEWQTYNKKLKANPAWCLFSLRAASDAPDSIVRLETEDMVAKYRNRIIGRHEEYGNDDERLWTCEPESWAAKIVVGWCLYKQGLSDPDLSWREQRREPFVRGRRGVTGIITEIDHVCTVLGQARLDFSIARSGEMQSSNSGFFKRPHWRSRHLARERGSPPTAPKTVKVPPRLIRKDLIPLFGIIGGTSTKVIEDWDDS